MSGTPEIDAVCRTCRGVGFGAVLNRDGDLVIPCPECAGATPESTHGRSDHRTERLASMCALCRRDRVNAAQSDDIVVTYTETAYDRQFTDDDGTVYVDGLPYRAEYDGLKAAATTPEGARSMIQSMLDRRVTSPVSTDGADRG